MAVLQMQRIYICGLKKDRKKILELLQRKGNVEIDDMIPESDLLKRADSSAAVAALEKNAFSVRDALQVLDKYSGSGSSLLSAIKGRKSISAEEYDEFYSKHDNMMQKAARLNIIPKLIAEAKAEMLKCETQKEILSPWVALDVPINFTGTKETACFIGALPNAWDYERIYERLAGISTADIEIVSSSKEQTCIFVICERQKEEEVFAALRAIGFIQSSAQTSTDTSDRAFSPPSQQIKELERKISDYESEIRELEKEAADYAPIRADLQFLYDFETLRSEKYESISKIVQSKNSLIISGYVPDKDKNDIKAAIEGRFTSAVEFEQPTEDEDVPVLLKNNPFSAPLEGTVESFSLPGKGEIDPTAAVSVFYYILFGLMLSDAVYGALIAGICAALLLKYRKTMEEQWIKTLRMYFYCGMSTVFWGVMFGSYLGDVVDIASETFFGSTITIPPLWFFPVKEPMRMLVFSMLFGLIHLLSGLSLKLYQLLRNKEYKAVLYDVIFWAVLLISLTLKLLTIKQFTQILGLSFLLSASVGNIAGILAALAAVGIILTNGRESGNPFKRFLKGLYALYGITGYLSDVLSYSRLLALGLATGVIATVINQMAAMAGNTVGGAVGFIIFLVVCLLGHLLNIAINALGAYVHTNRLQYVEFFGKFYGGGGRKFKPLSEKTKYYKIMEE